MIEELLTVGTAGKTGHVPSCLATARSRCISKGSAEEIQGSTAPAETKKTMEEQSSLNRRCGGEKKNREAGCCSAVNEELAAAEPARRWGENGAGWCYDGKRADPGGVKRRRQWRLVDSVRRERRRKESDSECVLERRESRATSIEQRRRDEGEGDGQSRNPAKNTRGKRRSWLAGSAVLGGGEERGWPS